MGSRIDLQDANVIDLSEQSYPCEYFQSPCVVVTILSEFDECCAPGVRLLRRISIQCLTSSHRIA